MKSRIFSIIHLYYRIPRPVELVQYAIGASGPGNRYIFLQMPSITDDVMETLVFVNDQANTIVTDSNKMRVYEEFKKLEQEKTHVYVYKARMT